MSDAAPDRPGDRGPGGPDRSDGARGRGPRLTWFARFAWSAVLLGVVGVALGAWLVARPGSGWSAVAPLSGRTYESGPGAGTVAAVLVAGGVLLVAGVVGVLTARRRR